jgi:hypothetical protein
MPGLRLPDFFMTICRNFVLSLCMGEEPEAYDQQEKK